MIYVMGPFVLVAFVVALGSIVAIIRGWVPAPVRPSARWPRLFGVGTLLCALAMGSKAVASVAFAATDIRRGVAGLVSVTALLLGVWLLRTSLRPVDAHVRNKS